MSELAVAALRFGLLLVLWILIISIVSSQGRDLVVGRRNKMRLQEAQAAEQAPEPAPVPAFAGAHAAGTEGDDGAPGPNAQNGPAGASQGSPAAARPAPRLATVLEVVEGPLAGTTVDLNGSPLLIGRAQDADLVLEDDYASGRHARLFPQGSRWFLEDLGSTNGTFVGGNAVTRALPVDPGTPIRVGKTVVELRS